MSVSSKSPLWRSKYMMNKKNNRFTDKILCFRLLFVRIMTYPLTLIQVIELTQNAIWKFLFIELTITMWITHEEDVLNMAKSNIHFSFYTNKCEVSKLEDTNGIVTPYENLNEGLYFFVACNSIYSRIFLNSVNNFRSRRVRSFFACEQNQLIRSRER